MLGGIPGGPGIPGGGTIPGRGGPIGPPGGPIGGIIPGLGGPIICGGGIPGIPGGGIPENSFIIYYLFDPEQITSLTFSLPLKLDGRCPIFALFEVQVYFL